MGGRPPSSFDGIKVVGRRSKKEIRCLLPPFFLRQPASGRPAGCLPLRKKVKENVGIRGEIYQRSMGKRYLGV